MNYILHISGFAMDLEMGQSLSILSARSELYDIPSFFTLAGVAWRRITQVAWIK